MDERVEAAVLASGQAECLVIYSAYESDEDDEPIDNLDQVAVRGEVVLVGYADDYWGGESSADYRSLVLKDPTWLEVCVLANRMIAAVNDHHHVFLEGLSRLPRKKVKGKAVGPVEYEFIMGS